MNKRIIGTAKLINEMCSTHNIELIAKERPNTALEVFMVDKTTNKKYSLKDVLRDIKLNEC